MDTSNAVDAYVGARIAGRRKDLGLTQRDLGEPLQLTSLQVQRYEGGHTRVSAATLFAIASRLGVPVSYFFEGLPLSPMAERPDAANDPDFEAEALLAAFARLTGPQQRRRLVALVVAMADGT